MHMSGNESKQSWSVVGQLDWKAKDMYGCLIAPEQATPLTRQMSSIFITGGSILPCTDKSKLIKFLPNFGQTHETNDDAQSQYPLIQDDDIAGTRMSSSW